MNWLQRFLTAIATHKAERRQGAITQCVGKVGSHRPTGRSRFLAFNLCLAAHDYEPDNQVA